MRCLVFASIVALAMTPILGGCSLVGAGIGSAVPRYETATPTRSLHLDEEIRVVLYRRSSPNESNEPNDVVPRGGGERVDGRYAGIRSGVLSVYVEGRVEPREIPLTEISEIRVRNGTYWATGLIAGGAVDATLLTLVIVAVTQAGDTQYNIGSFQ